MKRPLLGLCHFSLCCSLVTAGASRLHSQHGGASGGTKDPFPGQQGTRRPRASAPEVDVEQGRLRGRTLVTERGTQYDAFSGIPYAAPPVGDLRFKAPRPPKAWSGVRDARREGRICTQPILNITKILGTRIRKSMEPLHSEEIPGMIRAQPWLLQAARNVLLSGEDCLFVNVYSPRQAVRANRAAGQRGLPVIFWIYGGGFVWGEGGFAFYDPDLLMDQGVVVVTSNYRVGPLGFLSLGRESGAPGNAGIKDQAAALRWTYDNVAAFGGDPARITVWGESAGAVGAWLHIMNPRSAGLVHRLMASSGSAVHSWAMVDARHALKRARHLATRLRCRPGAAPRQLAECLRKVPAQRLSFLHEMAILPEDQHYILGSVAFIPVIEEIDNDLEAYDEPYVTEHPLTLLAKRQYAKVPMILGFNSGESLIMYTGLTREPSEGSLRVMDQDVTCLLRDEIMSRLSRRQAEALARTVRRFYFGHEQPVEPHGRSLDTFFKMLTGLFMYLDTLMLARYVAADPDPAAAPVFVYQFKYVGALNIFKNLLRIQQKETCHGDELAYVWRIRVGPTSKPLNSSAPEYRVRDIFSTMLGNFIKTGVPTPDSSLNVTWPAFSWRDWAYMDIGEEQRAERDFRRDVVGFWDEVYTKLVGGPIWSRIAEMEARRAALGLAPPPGQSRTGLDDQADPDLKINLVDP